MPDSTRTSRWPEAQDGLRTIIAASPTISAGNVPVDIGYPAGGVQREHVWIAGEVANWTQEWETTAVASAPIRERFTLTVLVSVVRRGDSYTAVRDRLEELVAAVERSIVEDHTLGGAVSVAGLDGGRVQEAIREGEREMLAELRVQCDVDLYG